MIIGLIHIIDNEIIYLLGRNYLAIDDYMLIIVAPDMTVYQGFLSSYRLKIGVVRTVNTSFALKQQKNTTVLPLNEL